MIRCLFVQISRDQRGQPLRKELLVEGEIIQIGRAAGCKILLLDHRVRLHHAVIRYSDNGKLYVESEDGADVLVNGSFVSSAEFIPGSHALVGPYELIAESPHSDYDLVLSVELIHPLQDNHGSSSGIRVPASLSEAGLAKRKPALLLAGVVALIFIGFLLIPSLEPFLPKWAGDLPLLFSKAWGVGEMTRGHHLMSANCKLCHQKPFEAVPESACESCHATVAKHVENKVLLANATKEPRCGECHQEHRGEKWQITQDTQCVTCHSKIKEKTDRIKLADIQDFGSDHPAFSLSFKTGPKEEDVVRISQNDKASLVENSGLKFPHALHLNNEGLNGANNKTIILGCPSCHQLGEAGVHFRPISMEKACQQAGCHALRFTPSVEGRQIPHGSERNVMTLLREHYAATAISEMAAGDKFQCGDGVGVGASKTKIEHALNCANHNADTDATILFSAPNGCSECHEITHVPDNKDAPWKIAPVTITENWLPHSRFSHSRHGTVKCTECHDKASSGSSSDVSIPAIEKCRECHVGSKQVKNKISSRCGNCHSFHNDKKHDLKTARLN